MKIYAVFFDFNGYEENFNGVFSTFEKAYQYINNEYNGNFEDLEHAIVEIEVDTNNLTYIWGYKSSDYIDE